VFCTVNEDGNTPPGAGILLVLVQPCLYLCLAIVLLFLEGMVQTQMSWIRMLHDSIVSLLGRPTEVCLPIL
jgi:hypothetical protein